MDRIMTNSEKVVGGRFGQGGRLRQVPLGHQKMPHIIKSAQENMCSSISPYMLQIDTTNIITEIK